MIKNRNKMERFRQTQNRSKMKKFQFYRKTYVNDETFNRTTDERNLFDFISSI